MYHVSAQGIDERMIRCTLLFLNIDTALEVRDSTMLPNHCNAKLISTFRQMIYSSKMHNTITSARGKLSVARLRPRKYYGN